MASHVRSSTLGLACGLAIVGIFLAPRIRGASAPAAVAQGVHSSDDAASDRAPKSVETTLPVKKTMSRALSVPATVQAYERVDVHTKVSGFVSEVLVDIGARVQRGEVPRERLGICPKTRHARSLQRTSGSRSPSFEVLYPASGPPAGARGPSSSCASSVGDRSLLQGTVDRLAPLVPPERVLILGSAAHVETVYEQLPEVPRENVLGEPCARGTLPCAAWAAAVIARRDPAAVMALLPADHVIAPAEAFRAALGRAAESAKAEDVPVVFGIRATYPATGFGWIEAGEARSAARRLVRFVEKPGEQQAIEFLASGRFAWNGGVFVWSARTIDALLAAHAPAYRAAFAGGTPSAAAFAALASQSIDVGIMERVTEARVVEADFTWSDVGSWNSLREVLDQDRDGNCAAGGAELVAIDAARCIVHGPRGTLTALIGVEDLVVARDGDAVLVTRIDRAQDVRKIVAELERRAPESL